MKMKKSVIIPKEFLKNSQKNQKKIPKKSADFEYVNVNEIDIQKLIKTYKKICFILELRTTKISRSSTRKSQTEATIEMNTANTSLTNTITM